MDSLTIDRYKDSMFKAISLLMPGISRKEIEPVLEYSVSKRFKNTEATLTNTYTNRIGNTDLLKIADYITSREPVICSSGVLFMKSGDVPNPLADTVQSFMDKRSEYKKKMLDAPKGSFEWSNYNLQQSLTF